MKNFKERFTIQFSSTDPQHVQAADILNNQNARSKAQYLVNAILHYEFCKETPNYNVSSQLDAKAVEAIVNRVLIEKDKCAMTSDYKQMCHNTDTKPEIDKDAISAIAQSLGSFRNNHQ